MTSTCPACGYATTTSSCPRCGFAAPVELAKTGAAGDTALFDATVARPSATALAGIAPGAAPPVDPYGGWPAGGTGRVDQPLLDDGRPAPWEGQPGPAWAGQAPPPPVPRPAPGDSAADDSAAESPVPTAVAHLVLWLGVLAVSAAYGPLANALYGTGSDSTRTLAGVVFGVLELLPFALAVVIAGRSATLRITALVGALTVLGGSVFLQFQSYDSTTWPLSVAMCVLGLATWTTARRHARLAYLVLVPALVGALLWFPTFGPGPTLRAFAYVHGVTSTTLLNLWSYLPLVVLAGLGLVSSLVRPRPARRHDALGWAVVGPLALITLVVMPIARVGDSAPDYTGASSGADYSGATGTPDYAGANDDPTTAATAFLDAARQGRTSVAGCNGDVGAPSVASYTIGQVSPATTGGFDVSATVTAADGTVTVVTVHIGTTAAGTGSCVESATEPTATSSSGSDQAGGGFPVPSLPASGDTVPSGTTVPAGTVGGTVIPYGSSSLTPSTADELVAHQPSDLSTDETAAVQSLIRFLTAINQQDFQTAWQASTYSTKASTYSSGFAAGYATSRHYEVSFGEPRQLTPTLIAVPATFVSRQDPAAQGNPAGVTDCTYWPQYVFLVASVGGTWLDDTAGVFSSDPSVAPLKRADPSRPGKIVLNPLSQRVAC